MEKDYPNFFELLKESSLNFDDKIKSNNILGKKYNLFTDEKMTDKSYYQKFPTIYHLRNYLVKTEQKVDIRLVYLAIHHIIKYRGNFLYDGDFSNNANEVDEKLNLILDFLNQTYNINLKDERELILKILSEKNMTKADKKDKVMACFEFEKSDKAILVNIINSFLGYSFDLNKIFESDFEKNKISFSSEIENEDEIKNMLQENAVIYEAMNEIYSWYILQDILKGKTYISEAMIEKYEKYAEDLRILKKVFKEYFPEDYKNMFRKYDNNNYVAYEGKNSGKTYKKCTPEEFFINLKKRIDKLPEECVKKSK